MMNIKSRNTNRVSTCQELISAIFREEAACAEPGRECPLFALVSFAMLQSRGLYVDPRGGEHYHAASCWNSVGNMLEEHERRGVGAARWLEGFLASASIAIPAFEFYGIVIENWDILADYTYTWRALADIVDMTAGWPTDSQTRKEVVEFLCIGEALFGCEGAEDA